MELKLIPQTNFSSPMINKYGCNFRALSAIAEIYTDEALEMHELINLADKCFKEKYMLSDCTVTKPEQIIAAAFNMLGMPNTARNIGYYKDGAPVLWSGKPTDYFDYCIVKLWQKNNKDVHFILCDKELNLLFDPTPNSISYSLWKNKETGAVDKSRVKDVYLYKAA